MRKKTILNYYKFFWGQPKLKKDKSAPKFEGTGKHEETPRFCFVSDFFNLESKLCICKIKQRKIENCDRTSLAKSLHANYSRYSKKRLDNHFVQNWKPYNHR